MQRLPYYDLEKNKKKKGGGRGTKPLIRNAFHNLMLIIIELGNEKAVRAAHNDFAFKSNLKDYT